ncbi:MAG TPA: hypothetical protein VMM82_08160, partial [Spirochaetia bacterium]|nr:hypothetical protein [Spirochaetia bacterium]
MKPAPDAVSDAEVSAARAALRQASEWGAKYYAPPMYATAQATFESALAARDGDPARCRSLLAQATDTANSARQAALTAYEGDVKNRFNASRAKLVEIGADRAFPDEFGQLVSGIDSATGLFADGSYWDARFKAYTILKGMTDLYDTVHGILDWLKDAQIRVQNAIDAAQALDALQWAPAAMRDAEGKYHDALAQMQAGNLKAAVDSMKAAGQIALNMPYLKDTMDRRGARAPASGVSPAGAPPEGARTLPREPAVQPPPVASSFPGQRVRIADMSMSSLGAPQKLYMTFSAAIARFDVVAAEGLSDAGVMEKVLSGMDDSWEAAVSRSGYFGFIYNDRIQMVKDLGAYPEKGQF